MYYRGAAAAVVVYDITNRASFQRAKSWVKELQRQGNSNIVIALSGNKLDLADQRQVETDEAKAYADENGIFFMETSAKTNVNVSEIFKTIAVKLPKTLAPPRERGIVVDSENQNSEGATRPGCCGGGSAAPASG